MKALLIRSVSVFFIVVFFMGTAGWVYSAHWCQLQKEGSEMSCGMADSEMKALADNCCSSGGEKSSCHKTAYVPESKSPDKYGVNSVAGKDCCVIANTFFSVPVYRIHAQDDLKSLQVFDVTGFPDFNIQIIFAKGQQDNFVPPDKSSIPVPDISLFIQSFLI